MTILTWSINKTLPEFMSDQRLSQITKEIFQAATDHMDVFNASLMQPFNNTTETVGFNTTTQHAYNTLLHLFLTGTNA